MIEGGKIIDAIHAVAVLVALASAVECAVGRVLAMDWRHHRPAAMLGYAAAALLCMAAALAPVEGFPTVALRLAAACIGVHLLATMSHWRYGPPAWAEREQLRQLVAVHADSRHDDRG